jgi:hypothetical protein
LARIDEGGDVFVVAASLRGEDVLEPIVVVGAAEERVLKAAVKEGGEGEDGVEWLEGGDVGTREFGRVVTEESSAHAWLVHDGVLVPVLPRVVNGGAAKAELAVGFLDGSNGSKAGGSGDVTNGGSEEGAEADGDSKRGGGGGDV